MCTLIAAFDPKAEHPLVVAANRDEALDRAASPPRLWPGPPPFLAPRDEVAGGTWLGLTAVGMFVGVTNRFGVTRDPARVSRGALVVEALGAPSAAELHRRLADLSPLRFNAFHLLYADRAHAFVTWSDGERLQQQALGPGLHVVTERSLGGDDHARTERIRAHWREHLAGGPLTADRLAELLRLHDPEDPLASTCVHIPAFRYGTRSGFILRLARTLGESELRWAEGAPGEHPFVDQGPLLRELAR